MNNLTKIRTKILIKDTFNGSERLVENLFRLHHAHFLDWCPSPIHNGFIIDSHRPKAIISNILKKIKRNLPSTVKSQIEYRSV